MNRKNDRPRYREIQRWSDVWLVLVAVVVIAATQWWWFIQQVLLEHTWGDHPTTDWLMLFMWLALGIGLPLFIYWLRMIVEVYPDRVVIDYRPLFQRKIILVNVVSVEPRVLGPQPQFSGWGVSSDSGSQTYNISGQAAVQLILRDRSSVVIGTRSADRLAAAILAARYDV
ncbi:MAG: DUF6141 family protein [Chloroflexota bacterium]